MGNVRGQGFTWVGQGARTEGKIKSLDLEATDLYENSDTGEEVPLGKTAALRW